MAFEIRAIMTDEAQRRDAEQKATGKNYVITGFRLGNAGHDPADPTTALTPDTGVTVLPAPVFGPKQVSGFTYGSSNCLVWSCILDFGEAVTQFSSIGLLAQITSSPVPNDPEIGTTFLFAVANFPQRPKLGAEYVEYQVGYTR